MTCESGASRSVTVSVVSHNQCELAEQFLADLDAHSQTCREVILTLNAGERLNFDTTAFSFNIQVIENDEPKGFGANHNAASKHATCAFFCVANPDIRITSDPFPALMGALDLEGVGVAGPLVVDPVGASEDNGRRFPTLPLLLRKFWDLRILGKQSAPDFVPGEDLAYPDWIGGMFMLFKSDTFKSVGGFDERYFLYYEDVDLCWRLRRAGYQVILDAGASVIHEAQRTSWKSWRYMRWHLASMARFLLLQAKG